MEEAALTSIKSIISFPSITPKSIHFLHFFAAQLSGAKKLKENWSWLKADCSCASEWRKEKWVRQSVAQRKGIEGWVGLVSWWRVNGWWASQWLRQEERTKTRNQPMNSFKSNKTFIMNETKRTERSEFVDWWNEMKTNNKWTPMEWIEWTEPKGAAEGRRPAEWPKRNEQNETNQFD